MLAFLFQKIRMGVWQIWKTMAFLRIYRRFRKYTMINSSGYVANLMLASRFTPPSGAVVECGTWKGGMIAGLVNVLGKEREYHLCDSFEGLPQAQQIDGEAALKWQSNTSSPTYYNNCRAGRAEAEAAMKLAHVDSYFIHEGWFEETLTAFPDCDIALLRLDADWYASTWTCLEHLWAKVVTGGLVIIDDYYTWDGCSRAVHAFLDSSGSASRVRQFAGICYILKEDHDQD